MAIIIEIEDSIGNLTDQGFSRSSRNDAIMLSTHRKSRLMNLTPGEL